MASYRRPKGTVVRPIPDWNVQNLYYASSFNAASGNLDYFDGVLNTETDGSSLIVWDCTIALGAFTAGVEVIGSADWFLAQVPPAPNNFGLAPVDPTQANPLSQMGHSYDTSNLVTGMPFYSALAGPGIWRWTNPFPMAVIRPGFALLVEFTYNNATASLSVIVEKAFFP
jgi:hypothetical protein